VLAADHAHSRDTLTARELVPPSGPTERGDASKLGWQRAVGEDGDVTLVEVDPPHAATSAAKPNGTMNRQPTRGNSTTRRSMHIGRQ
jgi:hypothetical protein